LAEVIAKNFGDDISAFDQIPSKELYIFPGPLPPDNVDDAMVIPNDTPEPFTFALSKMKATRLDGGSVKIVDSTTFKVSKTIAAAEVTVEVGGMRFVFRLLSACAFV
jgi:oxalate decarboxylase/phosphoglucose isomerase-like protein (cupin superfamily)